MLKRKENSNEVGNLALAPPKPSKSKTPFYVSLLFVLGTSLVAGLLWNSFNERDQTVVAAREITRGSQIQIADLRVVETAGVSNQFSSVDELVGKTVANSVADGDVITPSDLRTTIGIDSGTNVMGVMLNAGQYPINGLTRGDRVDVYSASTGGTSVIAKNVEVFDLEGDELVPNTDKLVSLIVSEDQARAIVGANSLTGGVRLVLRGDG